MAVTIVHFRNSMVKNMITLLDSIPTLLGIEYNEHVIDGIPKFYNMRELSGRMAQFVYEDTIAIMYNHVAQLLVIDYSIDDETISITYNINKDKETFEVDRIYNIQSRIKDLVKYIGKVEEDILDRIQPEIRVFEIRNSKPKKKITLKVTKVQSKPRVNNKTIRISKEEYFMNFARNAALRSTCVKPHRQVGAIAVKDGQIISTGYNGAPCSTAHCLDLGCLREKMNIKSGERLEICRAVHAEQNVIAHAAKHGVALKGSDLYITHSPCGICAKLIINAGISNIYYEEEYPDEIGFALLREAGVGIYHLSNI